MTPDFGDVVKRLARLEQQNDSLVRQNRRLKRAGAAAFMLGLVLTVASCHSKSSSLGTVEVEKLVLKGSDGKVQAVLGSSGKGTALVIFRPGEAATPAIGLNVGADGEPALELFDGQGKGRLQLKVSNAGESRMMMSDERGKERVLLSMNGPERGLWLWDDQERPRVVLAAVKETSTLTLLGPDHSSVFLENSPGQQRFMILNGKEVARIGLAVTPQGPFLGLFDEQGKELFSKP